MQNDNCNGMTDQRIKLVKYVPFSEWRKSCCMCKKVFLEVSGNFIYESSRGDTE